jgi:hypothetical protein
MTLVTIRNGKISRKEYKTQMNLNKAAHKAILEKAGFIGKIYDDGEQYIYNQRTGLFVRTK